MFKYKKSLNANQGRIFLEFTLVAGATFTIGDALTINSAGTLALATASYNIAGILEGFVTATGMPLEDNGASADFTNTYTTPSGNTVKGRIDVSKNSIYSCPADATVGTTTGSNLSGYTMDVVTASDTLDETSALTTTGQFLSLGLDPDPDAPDNSVLCIIYESQIFGPRA